MLKGGHSSSPIDTRPVTGQLGKAQRNEISRMGRNDVKHHRRGADNPCGRKGVLLSVASHHGAHGMSSQSRAPLSNVDRHGWWLWSLAFGVMLALTAAVPVLYLPMLREIENADAEMLVNGYYAVVGLAGLVLVFCLYTVFKQRELNLVRRRLLDEERELEDVRTRLSELSALFHVSTTLNLQLDPDSIVEIIVRRVVSTL